MHFRHAVTTITILGLLAACQQQGAGGGGVNKQQVGTIAGAAAGAYLGSKIGSGSGQLVGVAAGTLLGAAFGSEIGASLDRADMAYYRSTAHDALENAQMGETLPWRNPESGNSGTFTPTNYYQTASGTYCREYTQTIQVGGRMEEGHGTACREEDGTWKIVN